MSHRHNNEEDTLIPVRVPVSTRIDEDRLPSTTTDNNVTKTTTPYSSNINYYNNDNNNDNNKKKTLHIAPMLDVSNREFRALMRILSKKCILWTEMVVDETIVYTEDLDFHLGYDPETCPLILQLGSNNPEQCAEAIRLLFEKKYMMMNTTTTNTTTTTTATAVSDNEENLDSGRGGGYIELNLNMDCPSNRVSGKREFGAILMKKIQTAVAVVTAMKEELQQQQQQQKQHQNDSSSECSSSRSMLDTTIHVSVKCRIGVDEYDDLEYMISILQQLEPVCQRFYLHARKCVLGGLLSPAQNRKVPPLNYPRVYAICDQFPNCQFYINGGISTLKAAKLICYGDDEGESTTTQLEQQQQQNTSLLGNHYDESHNNDQSRHPQDRQQHYQHQVPCQLCNVSNGSCTAPPCISVVPKNLRGCMMGRAAMDHPCLFWDVDRYFYNEPSNPCQNRRDVLDQYIIYLETIYPRRCCDDDPRITTQIVTPSTSIDMVPPYCCIQCHTFYSTPSTSTDDDDDDDSHNNNNNNQGTYCNFTKPTTPQQAKISSHVIYRSLKPIMGIFYGLPKSKKFRNVLDQLTHDMSVRNCGPGYIVRRALQDVFPSSSSSSNLLDQPFCPTEDLIVNPTA